MIRYHYAGWDKCRHCKAFYVPFFCKENVNLHSNLMENCGDFDFSTSKHLFEDLEKKNTVYTFFSGYLESPVTQQQRFSAFWIISIKLHFKFVQTQILHCFSNRSLRKWWMVTVAKVSLSLKKVLIFPPVIVASGDVCSSPKYSHSNMTECTNWFC